MPNWIKTTCTITGPEADIERFKEACFYLAPTEEENGIDIERVLPMPEGIKATTISGTKDEALIASTGYSNWHDWSIANWGTKWAPDKSRYWVEEGNHKLFMWSANATPTPMFKKIVDMFPTLSFVDFSSNGNDFFIEGTISADGCHLFEEEMVEKMQDYLEYLRYRQNDWGDLGIKAMEAAIEFVKSKRPPGYDERRRAFWGG